MSRRLYARVEERRAEPGFTGSPFCLVVMMTASPRKRFILAVGLLGLLAALAGVALVAYRNSAAYPAFTVLDSASHPQGSPTYYADREPSLIIFAEEQDIGLASDFLPGPTMERLRAVDFNTHFAILAFRGVSPSIHKGFAPERLVRQQDTVKIVAAPGEAGMAAVINSPYFLLMVRKSGQWGRVITFNLAWGDNEPPVASVVGFIP